MTKNILIVKGGKYAEAEVSRKTAINVEKALNARGHNTTSIEPQDNLISYLNDNKENIDIIFNALHGSWGEDGKIQGLFEYFSIPYTHSGVSSSAVGMNKFLSKSIFLNNNIVVPKGKIFINKNLNIEEEFARPYVIKPINEGSSVGVKLIKKNTDINIFLKNKYLDHLMEEYIPGIDLTVGLMSGKVIGMLEVITEKEIYDYEFKYNSKNTKYVIPTNLDPKLKKEIYSYSKKSFQLLNCKGIARVDFRLNLESEGKKVFLLEINTQPGLTENSLFPKIAKNSGLEFPDLVEWIIKDAGVNR
jgi:D-alanine-D-alanine ligase